MKTKDNLNLSNENLEIENISKQIKELKMIINKKEDDLKNLINEKNEEIKELNNKLINQGYLYENKMEKLNLKIEELANKLENKISEQNNTINKEIINIYEIFGQKNKEINDDILYEMENIEKQITESETKLNNIIPTPKSFNDELKNIFDFDFDKIFRYDNSLILKSCFSSKPSDVKENNKKEYEIIKIIKAEEEDEGDEKDKDLKIYRYSNIKPLSKHDLVFQHFYDHFDSNDLNNAYIVLFIGGINNGKTTAINALFNIIKGIKIEDKHRFILIEEIENKNYGLSQTKGIHLYYLKDYNDKPIIIIDTQGYCDINAPISDEKLNFIFKFVFEKLIDHINIICYTFKASYNRIDLLMHYSLTQLNLYSKNMIENIIFLATFANGGTLKNGPPLIDRIKDIPEYAKFIGKIKWFACNSRTIFDNNFE